MQRLIKTVKATELIAGTSVLLCSLWIFSPADQVDISNSEVLSGLLLLLAPALLVFLGCYRQVVHRRMLGMVLVLIGTVWSFMVSSGVNADGWALRLVRFQLCLLLVACAASCFQTLWEFLNLLTLRTSSK